MTPFRTSAHRQSGLSLVELMIALTIGLMLLVGLTLIFANSSEANRELQKTAQQIENGRYAIDILTQDLHHAGYYGHFYDTSSIAAVASPDPCEIANLLPTIPTPVQGFRAADLATRPDVVAATTCDDKGLLTAANLRPGSDILVVRRASTVALAPGATVLTNEVYIQANGVQAEVQFGVGGSYVAGNKADGSAATIRYTGPSLIGTAVPIRKYVVHVYFVAPCSAGTGANGVCTGNPPEDTIPTLKRLELGSTAGATTMNLVPLVEGIEYLKVEYGIDSAPASPPSVITGQTGDSTVDSYATAPGDWTEVVGVRVYVLARNTTATAGFTDDKSYVLGAATVAPATYAGSEGFKRHAFTAAVRLSNLAGRREVP